MWVSSVAHVPVSNLSLVRVMRMSRVFVRGIWKRKVQVQSVPLFPVRNLLLVWMRGILLVRMRRA